MAAVHSARPDVRTARGVVQTMTCHGCLRHTGCDRKVTREECDETDGVWHHEGSEESVVENELAEFEHEDAIDFDEDGVVSTDEVKLLLSALGERHVSMAAVQHLKEELDRQGAKDPNPKHGSGAAGSPVQTGRARSMLAVYKIPPKEELDRHGAKAPNANQAGDVEHLEEEPDQQGAKDPSPNHAGSAVGSLAQTRRASASRRRGEGRRREERRRRERRR